MMPIETNPLKDEFEFLLILLSHPLQDEHVSVALIG